MQKTTFTLSLFAAAALLAGCVSPKSTTATQTEITNAKNFANNQLQRAKPITVRELRERQEEVDAPYIVSKSVPLARSVSLPKALQQGVKTAVMFPESWVSLSTAAERIMLASGIVVNIAPDVYLDGEALQRKTAKAGAAPKTEEETQPVFATMPTGMSPLPLPSPLGGPQKATVASPSAKSRRGPETAYGFDFPRVEAPLSQILDVVATRLAINWRYDEASNSIRFYRLITKSWQTPFSSASSRFTTTLEGGTSQSSNTNALSAQTNAAPITTEMRDVVELNSIRDSIDAIMTRSGSITANASTGTITLTDTKDVLEVADELIRKEIKLLSRVVNLRVQTIQVTTKNNREAGMDLTAAVSRALNGLPDLSLTIDGPSGISTPNIGSIGINILSGPAAGSSSIVKALQEVGDVQTSTELPLLTRNRQPVYYNVRNTFSYVSATTAAAATTGGTGGTPGITTAQDSVGLKLVMFPNVTSKDTVLLTMALDQSILQSIETFSSGSGASMQSVQLPNVNGEGSSQQVPIRNGQTIVLTGFDRKANQYDKRTLGDGVPLFMGGSLSANQSRSTTIVLVTAEIRDID